jgi:hypothetical protein
MTYELKPSALIGWSFDILQQDRAVGTLVFKLVRPAGTLELNGATYQISRDGLFGAFSLTADGREIARAERTSLLRVRYSITAEDRQLVLQAKGFLQRVAQVFHGDIAIATISRPSLVRRGITVEDSEVLPLPTLMFCAGLMLLFWRHRARATR